MYMISETFVYKRGVISETVVYRISETFVYKRGETVV